jgi:DNA-binding response OmpR family regulator
MGDSAALKLLVVEDHPEHARLVQAYLARSSDPSLHVFHADTLAAAVRHLGVAGIDLILLDLTLPDSQGLDTFRTVHAHAPSVPIVVLSGNDDEELAVQAVREGAQDYLTKGDLGRESLLHAVRFAIERHKQSPNNGR